MLLKLLHDVQEKRETNSVGQNSLSQIYIYHEELFQGRATLCTYSRWVSLRPMQSAPFT